MSRGRKFVPLSKKDVERAIMCTKSNAAAARYLGVSLEKYKQAAERYTNEAGVNFYESHKNLSGAGIPKLSARKGREPLLMDILEGRVTAQYTSLKRVKERLIEEGFIEECCGECGYKERRIMDEKIPLILSFLDNNKKNWRLDNLKFLCYNCYYLYVGDIFEKAQLDVLENPQKVLAKKTTQLDLPPQHEDLIDRHLDLNNKRIREKDEVIYQEKPDDYGADLISFVSRKTKRDNQK